MSWSIEEHIGEGRPWPEQVVVYRGETDESLTYARRSLSDVNKMVELMDTLAAENTRLRELVLDMMRFFEDGDWCTTCEQACKCESQEQYEEDCLMRDVFHHRMRELEIEDGE